MKYNFHMAEGLSSNITRLEELGYDITAKVNDTLFDSGRLKRLIAPLFDRDEDYILPVVLALELSFSVSGKSGFVDKSIESLLRYGRMPNDFDSKYIMQTLLFDKSVNIGLTDSEGKEMELQIDGGKNGKCIKLRYPNFEFSVNRNEYSPGYNIKLISARSCSHMIVSGGKPNLFVHVPSKELIFGHEEKEEVQKIDDRCTKTQVTRIDITELTCHQDQYTEIVEVLSKKEDASKSL